MAIKIHILFSFKNKPWGGGNQFLSALKHYFECRSAYTSQAEKADVILFNSHQSIMEVLGAKRKFENCVFIHRIDGPIYLTRGTDRETDRIIYSLNQSLADATIFQSEWSKTNNLAQGFKPRSLQQVIMNAPDPTLFFPASKIKVTKKIKLIASSWSSNIRKGFEYYKFLDDYLDFDKYEMSFIGNSPIEFKNFNKFPPMDSSQLAVQLKRHDLFITASEKDPCSNSLIEALHCGLPAVGLNDGGHPEIIGKGGELFSSKVELLEKIKLVSSNLFKYRTQIAVPDLAEVGDRYLNFCEKAVCCRNSQKNGKRNLNSRQLYMLFFSIRKLQLQRRIIAKLRSVKNGGMSRVFRAVSA